MNHELPNGGEQMGAESQENEGASFKDGRCGWFSSTTIDFLSIVRSIINFCMTWHITKIIIHHCELCLYNIIHQCPLLRIYYFCLTCETNINDSGLKPSLIFIPFLGINQTVNRSLFFEFQTNGWTLRFWIYRQ